MAKYTTLKDIAKKLGITITTVSKVINNHPDISDKTRKIVLKAIDDIGYIHDSTASNLRKRKNYFIGLIISDNTNPYFAELVKGVEETNASRDYLTLIFNTDENLELESKFISALLGLKVAGVILTPAKGDDKNLKILKKYEVPYVLINRYINIKSDNYVVADDTKAGFIGTNHLIEKRHKKVIFINGLEGISSSRDRFKGYKKALSSNNIPLKKDSVYKNIMSQEEGYEIINIVLKHNKPPFSILCYSDYVAIGIIRNFLERNIKIPEEIAVMGIDNIDLFSYSHPKLSTIHIPKREIGIQSANILFDQINNRNVSKKIILEPKLIIRETA